MFVTPSSSLAGVLPVVISGGRPLLSHRCTRRLLPYLLGRTADPVWLVREDRAAAYERDQYELATFGKEEAEAYAATHWTSPDPFAPGAFLGGFTEREFACRLAAERGYWAVLQLDDNLFRLRPFSGLRGSGQVVNANGGLGLYADILAAVTLATNSRMTGAALAAVNPAGHPRLFVRAGFPYSLFLERVDRPDREEYYGPFEDDILHAYQYLSRADDATTALVAPLAYEKDHVRSAKTGMRAHYDERRAEGLQMVCPEAARVAVIRGHANGRGGTRVFHRMTRAAIRTPLVVRDQELFARARRVVTALRDDQFIPAFREGIDLRIAKRAAAAERTARLRAHLAGQADRAGGKEPPTPPARPTVPIQA